MSVKEVVSFNFLRNFLTPRSRPSAIPDPPENLRWRDKSASSIFLTWEPPKYDGGSSIRGYNLDRCQRGTDKWEPCGEVVPELKFQVTGLIEGQWYSYRVRALNRLGASQPCKATDEIQAVDPKGTQKLIKIKHNLKDLSFLSIYST